MKSKTGKRPSVAHSNRRCPIVGIGASAGGLEAFTQLLGQLPLDTGFGFVLVQHLDPQHPSALSQLLARTTTMPVCEVTNNQRVEANHVYIIPPNTALAIANGVLKLQPRGRNRIAPRSIDFFFESLAKDQQERAIGVILSGNATDGTLGLEAIKAEGGLTFAQDASAKYASMPRSAATAGCVDFVLSPAKIARELARIARHPYLADGAKRSPLPLPARSSARSSGGAGASADPADRREQDGYQRVLLLLRNHSGVDFSLYKNATIHRRMVRRVVLNQQESLGHYADFLRGNAKELDALYSDTLISVTSFFRNTEAFAVLKTKVFARLLQQPGDDPLRVWVLGCSTGQEAYSIAIAFAESAKKVRRARTLQIFATDLNDANLSKARHALYDRSLVQDVSPERLRRYFVEEEGGYRVIKSLREQVVFARHNLINDPPFSRMDLISCRNLMIYLEPSLQKKALPAFHYALKPEGFLFLGASESIGNFTDLFAPVDKKQKIFSRKVAPARAFELPVRRDPAAISRPGKAPRPASAAGTASAPAAFSGEVSAEREADRITINHFAPPGVLIDDELQILQFRGVTGDFLEPPTGKARFDLLKMARDGLMLPLRAAINRARKEQQTVRRENLTVNQDGSGRSVNIEVVPLKNLKESRFLILFEDSTGGAPRPPSTGPAPSAASPVAKRRESTRVAQLEHDLAETRDYLQSIQEHQESANEELQAANEEGQSANEELQSLNEELETSKEELESTNEELTTVNEEMVNRNNDLNRANSDLINLQTSAKLVILLLGRDLTIRRFSAQASKQFGLHLSDQGRSLASIRHHLALGDLGPIVREVITSVQEFEREVQDRDGHWFSLRIRPYVNLDNKIDGAVLVLVDTNATKVAELAVVQARDLAEAIISTARDPLLILDENMRVRKVNAAYLTTFRSTKNSVVGHRLFELDQRCWNIPKLRRMLREIMPRRNSFDNFEVERPFAKIGRRTMQLYARTLNQDPSDAARILLGFQDITLRRRDEAALAKARAQLTLHAGQLERLVVRRTGELTTANHRLVTSNASVTESNNKFQRLFQESLLMQQKLRQLTRQIITVQEQERKQISRELHDEVVQTLVGINVELSALLQGSAVGETVRRKIARTQRLVERSVNAVHRFARGLRPAVLDDLGLVPALLAYSKSVATQYRFKIHVTAFKSIETLGEEVRTVLYRVAQEALTNVGRHARATAVNLTFSRIPGAIRMEIADNGKSFRVNEHLEGKNRRRLGLVGMKERVEMIGGTLAIISQAGSGTLVRVETPHQTKGKKS